MAKFEAQAAPLTNETGMGVNHFRYLISNVEHTHYPHDRYAAKLT